jgi:hypothetical protein
MFQLLVMPFLALGVILTLSLYGIYFGLPLLLLTLPPFRAGRRVVRHPDDPSALKRLARAAGFAGTVLTAVVIATVAVGWDDLDSLDAVAGLVVSLAWITGFWWVAFAAHRLVQRS